ncbi:MAG TPA: hemerythrin domain-containing protein [Gammaproteobacteria bacterium]|nr:hemerythrin domain-containing protein [Gammaproteobacteria bacterium]
MTNKSNDTPRLIALMLEDHTRFGQSLDALHGLVAEGADPAAAQAMVEQFELRLSRHLYAENEVLVPRLEIPTGSTEVHVVGAMLQDHDRIRSLSLRLLHMVRRRAEAADVIAVINQLRDTLNTHTHWEEEQVYPLLGDLGQDDHAMAIMHGDEDDEVFGDPLLD